jgi:membrane protease YdiL (CAAX protease family)
MVLTGLGAGLGFPSLMTLAMSGATPSDSGLASGLVNTSAQVGGAIGLAVLATLASERTDGLLADGEPAGAALNAGFHLAYVVGAALALAAIAIAAVVTVAAPIAEEIAFRGYLFAALTTWRGPWPAAIVTGLLFGAAHVAVYPPELLPALAFFGVAACLLFWFTGSLLPCIAVHAFNNAIAMGALAGWSWEVPLVVIGAVVLSVVLVLPFARERAPQAA